MQQQLSTDIRAHPALVALVVRVHHLMHASANKLLPVCNQGTLLCACGPIWTPVQRTESAHFEAETIQERNENNTHARYTSYAQVNDGPLLPQYALSFLIHYRVVRIGLNQAGLEVMLDFGSNQIQLHMSCWLTSSSTHGTQCTP